MDCSAGLPRGISRTVRREIMVPLRMNNLVEGWHAAIRQRSASGFRFSPYPQARRTMDDSAPFAAPGTDSKSAGDAIVAPTELHVKPQAPKDQTRLLPRQEIAIATNHSR